ncbi:LPXTG cell wall anchor domain-containing protein [Dactylosporangium sp. AC04546]|uniref:LPXTG cell wall anchor domain-containing protein n=1 Tax=Dactylosporangium sp. AC04546 TaxID=2862460 RepID=UPI001EDE625D|nr:LPXTG cell wall anchor domain-containing protein [Dactylosporangium sp. AC04546]WVK79040.1 LPXTG cell wall anchor domain-containing protein [Dactylosporangium sp. AC04546]
MADSKGEARAWPGVVALVGLVVGVILVCSGLFRQPWSDEVDCGGDSMQPGDICRSSRGASYTYEDRLAVRENGTWLLLAGVAAIGGGALFLGVRGRRKD